MDPQEPRAGRHPAIPWLWAALLFLLLAAFLVSDIPGRPIVLWDESRLAVNALEMSRTGFSLITTYGFKPDLWNTKPPLLIWLEAASIDAFGPSEWAVRLPSFLASLATVALVMAFGWRVSRSRFVMLAAPVFLVLSPGYFGGHAAHAADYESLLCLLTTAYVLLLFELIHRLRPKPWAVAAMGLLVALACLTKGVAGVMPGLGVFVYVIVRGRAPRLIRSPWYALAGLLVAILVGGYYALRELARPGYLAAVAVNELGPRYLHGMNGHTFGPSYYPEMVLQMFAIGPALVLLFAAPFLGYLSPKLRWRPTKSAAFLAYSNYVSIALMLVYTLSRTKIYWYIVPIYPFLSLALAIVCAKLLSALPKREGSPLQLSQVLIATVAAYMVIAAVVYKVVLLPRLEDIPQARYGKVFAQLSSQGFRRIAAIDGGVANDDDLEGYAPQMRFYSLAWGERGLAVTDLDPDGPPVLAGNQVLVTCDARLLAEVQALGRAATNIPDCAAAAAPGAPGRG